MAILKVCLDCGRPFEPTLQRQRRCAEHEPRGRQSRSPTTRAQDAEYARNREIVLAAHPRCYWCGEPDADTVDHIVPVALGGSNRRDNLVPACRHCNFARQARSAPAR
jgi:5-methylcytosine-specific restriction endonuclease McrA